MSTKPVQLDPMTGKRTKKLMKRRTAKWRRKKLKESSDNLFKKGYKGYS